MICQQIVQTKQGLGVVYQILDLENNQKGMAQMPVNAFGCSLQYFEQGNMKYEFRYKQVINKPWGKKQDKEYHKYTILNKEGNPCGAIIQKDKPGVFTGYGYHEIHLHDKVFQIYCIGCGKQGRKYPLYECASNEEIQVGLMEKSAIVKDMKDRCVCYTKNAETGEALILYALYVDVMYFRRSGKFPIWSHEIEYTYTKNKELLKKYDPDFLKKND